MFAQVMKQQVPDNMAKDVRVLVYYVKVYGKFKMGAAF